MLRLKLNTLQCPPCQSFGLQEPGLTHQLPGGTDDFVQPPRFFFLQPE